MQNRDRDGGAPDHRWRLWMVAAQAGDGATYEMLLRELLPYVRSLVARRIRDPADREDIVQNVLISLHRARHTYRAERPFLPWLRAVVRNASIDSLRARGRRSRVEIAGDVETLAEASYEARLPGEDVLSPALQGALAALPASQREAVELIHVEGLSVAEAAERAGVTPGALKVRAHRGDRRLRTLLADRAR